MIQSFRRVKIDVNDRLYSEIIRFGVTRCLRCGCVKALQCAHIIGRKHYTTRFVFLPKPNAIALCSDCHSWLDTHKMRDLIFDAGKRVFNEKNESYTFLVKRCGYSWGDLQKLYLDAQGVMRPPYSWQKKDITKKLRSILDKLKARERYPKHVFQDGRIDVFY